MQCNAMQCVHGAVKKPRLCTTYCVLWLFGAIFCDGLWSIQTKTEAVGLLVVVMVMTAMMIHGNDDTIRYPYYPYPTSVNDDPCKLYVCIYVYVSYYTFCMI